MSMRRLSAHALVLALGLALVPHVGWAGPIRLTSTALFPLGETNFKFVDAVTASDGGLYVLTSGLAGSQARLRLSQINSNGSRKWSRSIDIPSAWRETGELLKQASLLALPNNQVLVLSRQSPSADVPGTTMDIASRVFDSKGAVIATRTLASILLPSYGTTASFDVGQTVLDTDGMIWIAANGPDISAEGSTVRALYCFDRSLQVKGYSATFGYRFILGSEGQEQTYYNLGLSPNPRGGIVAVSRHNIRLTELPEDFNIGISKTIDKTIVSEVTQSGGGLSENQGAIHETNKLFLGSFFGYPDYPSFVYDGAVSGGTTLISLSAEEPNMHVAQATGGSDYLRAWSPGIPSNSALGIEPLPNGDFLSGSQGYGSSWFDLSWRKVDGPDNDLSPYAQLSVPADGIVQSRMKTADDGTLYLPGGPTVSATDSVGLSVANYFVDGVNKPTLVWQLPSVRGQYSAQAILPTVDRKLFAIGFGPSGELRVQLYQEPTYFRGINVTSPTLSKGAKGTLRILFGQNAPAGGYTVQLTVPSRRFDGIPAQVTVPEGKNFVEIPFTVLAKAPVGKVRISARGNLSLDPGDPVHTTTVEIR